MAVPPFAPSVPTAPAAPVPLRLRVVTLLIPLCICAILSGLMTWLNIGFTNDFAWRWLTSFASALPMVALGLALMSVYDKQLRRLLPAASNTQRKLMLAVCMALTLEFLMSFAVTLRNVGFAEGYLAAWATAFVRSLPVGLFIGLLMGFVVRPLLQRLATSEARA